MAILFDPGFLQHLAKLRFASDVDAMLEGTAAFAPEPLLRVQGPLLECQLAGVRLDSGDLASLSREARRLLDEAGLGDARIIASNDLDERSDDPEKASLPGALQVRRRFERGRAAGDTIFDLLLQPRLAARQSSRTLSCAVVTP